MTTRSTTRGIPITQTNPLAEFREASDQQLAVYQELRKWIQPSARQLRKSKSSYLKHIKETGKHYEKRIDHLLLHGFVDNDAEMKNAGCQFQSEAVTNQFAGRVVEYGGQNSTIVQQPDNDLD